MSSTRAPSVDGTGVQDALDDAGTVLLLSPDTDHSTEACMSMLSGPPPEGSRLLVVSLDSTPDDVIDLWRSINGPLPSETGVIAVGEVTRSAASSPAGPGAAPVTIDSVADPADLTGLAMAIGPYLDAWSESSRTPAVCFHSITSLLFHADQSRVFRFLHSTTGRLRDIGAIAHYHLNPAAHDEATVNRFAALFDAVVEVHDDGAVTVRTRN